MGADEFILHFADKLIIVAQSEFRRGRFINQYSGSLVKLQSGLKISKSRGAGGHNGVQSVMNALGNSLVRLRLGVGPNPNPFDSLAKYVLSAFNSEESNKLNDRKDYFMNALFKIVDDGVDSAMNLFNQNLNTNTPK